MNKNKTFDLKEISFEANQDNIITSEYNNWFIDLKLRIRQSQIKAAVKVNIELLRLYWQMGNEIVEKQKNAHCGDGFLKQLSKDLLSEFPDMKGFSYRNLKFIRQWHSFYNNNITKGKQVVSQFETLLFSIPWGHHILIMQRCKDIDKAIFYIKQRSLEDNIYRFLLELGKGFSFVGRQVKLEVGGDDFYCDMLFYHIPLKRYVVIELKTGKFEPEYVSKVNFYCNAVNHLIKGDDDNDTIGLLICKERNDIVAEWTIENAPIPIGISKYELQNLVEDI